MFKGSRHEYSVKTCPTSDVEGLENLLNEMSVAGWELYTMNEAESQSGSGYQYNCIFVRDFDDEESEKQDVDSIDLGDFRSKMEKIFHKEPYFECREVQGKIKQKRERIQEIKACLDSTVIDDQDRAELNAEMSEALKELEDLKQTLLEVISPDKMYDSIDVKKISILISEELLELVNPDSNAELISQTVKVRQELTDELGYVIPSIQFKVDETLEAGEYQIKVRDITVLEKDIYPNHKMFLKKELDLSRKPSYAIEDIDYITGEKIWWIPIDKTEKYWAKGLLPQEVIAKNLKYIAKRYIDDIFDYNDVNQFVGLAAEKNLYLIENIIPDFISLGELRYILSTLIRENVSVKDVAFIFEKINDFSEDNVKEDLLEKIRISLNRQISQSVADENKNIYGIKMSAKSISKIRKTMLGGGETITIEGSVIKKLTTNIEKILNESDMPIKNIALIAPIDIRQILFHIFEQVIPNLAVIADEELSAEFNLETIGEI